MIFNLLLEKKEFKKNSSILSMLCMKKVSKLLFLVISLQEIFNFWKIFPEIFKKITKKIAR